MSAAACKLKLCVCIQKNMIETSFQSIIDRRNYSGYFIDSNFIVDIEPSLISLKQSIDGILLFLEVYDQEEWINNYILNNDIVVYGKTISFKEWLNEVNSTSHDMNDNFRMMLKGCDRRNEILTLMKKMSDMYYAFLSSIIGGLPLSQDANKNV